MRRKLVRHGPSSLTISLPMAWVKRNDLKNGDELDVIEKGADILISGHGDAVPREITMTISDKDKFIKRLFVMPYVRGYDIINIRFESSKVLEEVQKNIGLLYGFEIINQGKSFCSLKNIAVSKPEELRSMELRLFNLCTSVLKDLQLFIKGTDEDAVDRIQLMENSMNRIDMFCRRLINRGGGGLEMRKAGSTYTIIRILEEMGDIGADIARIDGKLRDDRKKAFLKITDKIINSFDLLRKIRYKGEIEHIHEYIKIEDALWKGWPAEKDLRCHEFKLYMQLKQLTYKLHDLSEEVLLWAHSE